MRALNVCERTSCNDTILPVPGGREKDGRVIALNCKTRSSLGGSIVILHGCTRATHVLLIIGWSMIQSNSRVQCGRSTCMTPGPSYRGSAETWWMCFLYTAPSCAPVNECVSWIQSGSGLRYCPITIAITPAVIGALDKHRVENDRLVITAINRNYVRRAEDTCTG